MQRDGRGVDGLEEARWVSVQPSDVHASSLVNGPV